jgi:CubicO group peptidase (beta-lactamase class C family)
LNRILSRVHKCFFILALMLCNHGFRLNAQFFDPTIIDPVINDQISNTGPVNFILIKNGNQIYDKSYLYGNEKILSSSRIKISSASIWLASAAILSLIDKGYFTLDTEIGKILPQFKGSMAKITIRQLLSHTSGFPTNTIYIKDRALTLAQSVDSIALNVKLLNTPGKTFAYGAVGIQVAARIAEITSGKSWEQVFFEQIAKPCLMYSTDFGKAKSVTIADAAYSTSQDYASFLKMILAKGNINGIQVLSEKMITEMLTAQTEGLPMGVMPYKFKTSQSSRYYGLGVWIERINPNSKIGTEVSCQGARGFTPWINTCKNVAAVFAVYGDLKSSQIVIENVKEIIDEGFTFNCNDVSTENLTSLESIAAGLKSSDPSTTPNTIYISFNLSEPSFVTLKLFDPLGNEISQLLNRQMQPGEHSIPLKTRDLPSGVYFYRLKVNERLETRKINIKK